MQLSRVIRRVMELATAARKEREEWDERYSVWGRGPDDQGDYARAIVTPGTVVLPKSTYLPAYDALYEFLLHQPVAVTFALAALTALGRRERELADFEVMYDDERRFHGRVESALRYVAEKVYL